MRALIVSLAVASPAMAQDAAFWGGTGCQIVPVENAPHIAEIQCRNLPTTGDPITEAAITAGGATVAFVVDHQPGDIPDSFTFTALDGLIVIPEALTLTEHARGVALVYEWAGM